MILRYLVFLLSGLLLLSFLWLGKLWYAPEQTDHLALIPDDAELTVVVNNRVMSESVLYEYLDNRKDFEFFKEFQQDEGSSFFKESGASGIDIMSPVGLFMKTVGGKRILGMVLALSDQEAFLPYAETTWSLNNRTADWWHSAETAVSVQDNAAILLHCLHCEFSQNLLNDWKKPKSSNALKRDQKVSASVRVNVPENKLIKTIFPAHQWNASITTDYGRILLDAETDYWTQEGLGQNQTQGGFSIDKSTGIVMNAYILDVKEQGFASLQEIRDFDYFRNAGLFEQLTGHVSMHVLAVNNIKDNVRSVVDGQDVEVSDNRYDAETDVWLRVTDANKVTEILNVALDSGIITMSDGFWTFQTDYETLRIYAKVHKNYIQLCTDKILFNRTEFDEELKPNPVFELKIGITDLLKRVSGSMSIFANAALDVNIVDGLEIKWVSGQRFSGEIKLTDKRTDALLSIMKFIISSPQVLVLLRNYI